MDPATYEVEKPTEPKEVSGGEVVINMESMIKNYHSSISKLKEETKKQKEMLDDIFANDPTFQDHSDKSKSASTLLKQTKAEVLKRPQASELNEKVKNGKAEIKELQGAMSDYLQEYARMSGVSEIEMEDGTVMKIQFEAKLVRAEQMRMF
jgi:hypothetical protein